MPRSTGTSPTCRKFSPLGTNGRWRLTWVVRGHRELAGLIRDVLAEGAAAGHFRADIGGEELATYCMHAIGAASHLPSKAAVRRLVKVTLAGVRAPG